MAIGNSIKSQEFGNDKQILIAPELAFTIGCLVGNTGVSANAEGRKIIKAGTPVGGATKVLTNRQTVLAEATGETAQGVVLHDVDVTDGDANATLVIEGVIDVLKVEADVAAKLTTAAANLPKITVMNGYKG
jgi:hypothetical protein